METKSGVAEFSLLWPSWLGELPRRRSVQRSYSSLRGQVFGVSTDTLPGHSSLRRGGSVSVEASQRVHSSLRGSALSGHSSARRVRVLPGNPSLPLRVLLGGMERRMNGGLDGTALGIDLSRRSGEVAKLFYSGGFTGVLLREGHDPEEFLQEVYRGLLARNRGTCPWDYRKSSFGHYVHIVIRCVLANYLRRERLHTSRETVTEDGEMGGHGGGVGGGFGAIGTAFRDLVEGAGAGAGVGSERWVAGGLNSLSLSSLSLSHL